MKNVKWTANELLDSLNRELNQDEVNELYKALIAYSFGLAEITDEIDNILDDVIAIDYFDNDSVCGIVNEEVIEKASERLSDYLN